MAMPIEIVPNIKPALSNLFTNKQRLWELILARMRDVDNTSDWLHKYIQIADRGWNDFCIAM